MEHNWERTLPYLELSNTEIHELFKGILKKYEVKNISRINEGCRTTNYKIDTEKKGSFILKIFFEKEESYKKEVNLYNKFKSEIIVPKIHKFDVDEIIENREYIIYEYLEGESISSYIRKGNKIEEKFVRQVAYAMARIHENKYDAIGFLNEKLEIEKITPPLYEWYGMFMGKNAEMRLGKEIKNEINRLVEINKDILKDLDKEPRLVHGDLQGTNILIDSNGNLSGILDWEFCMSSHPIADIGQFFRYDEYFNKNLIHAFENEYRIQSDYNLNKNWYEISKLRDITNLIQLIDKEEDMPNKYLSIMQKMKKILEKLKEF